MISLIFSIIGILFGLVATIFLLFIIVGAIKLVFGGLFFMGGFILKFIGQVIFWVIAILVCGSLILSVL